MIPYFGCFTRYLNQNLWELVDEFGPNLVTSGQIAERSSNFKTEPRYIQFSIIVHFKIIFQLRFSVLQ